MKYSCKKKKPFIQSNNAVISYPIYLLVTVIISSTALILILYGVQYLSNETSRQQIEEIIQKITYEVETITAYADSGTVQRMKISLPHEMTFLCFGGKPNNSTCTNSNDQRNHNITNLIYYKMKNGQEFYQYSTISFIGETNDTYALLNPGSYDIIISIEAIEMKSYAKIIIP